MGQEVVNYGAAVNDGLGDALHIAFTKLDAGARLFTVIDKDLTAPPGAPTVGNCYIVGAAATDDWDGEDGNIAIYGLATTWRFIAVVEGMFAFLQDENKLYRYDGAAWIEFKPGGGPVAIRLSMFAGGELDTSELLFRDEATEAYEIPAGMTGSRGSAGVAATAETVLSIQKNGVEVGTATWAIAGTAATLAMASLTAFAAGDILTVVAPASADDTLADVSLSIVGELV